MEPSHVHSERGETRSRIFLDCANSYKFEPIFAFMRKAQNCESDLSSTKVRELFLECKSLARMIRLEGPICSLSPAEVSSPSRVPTRALANMMVDSYFASFESFYRILHEPTFRKDYRRYWEQPETATNATRLTILLVMAIGSSLLKNPDTRTELRTNIPQWILSAQNWLSGPLEKDCLNVAGVQLYCLTLLAREVFQVGGDLLWVSAGSLIHRAMQIGLHRDPMHLPQMTLLQSEVRRRLWATILEMVLQSSLDSGLPARISIEESDTGAPSNINDREIDGSTTVLPVHPETTYTTTSIQIMLFRALPVRLEILQLLNSLHTRLSYSEVIALDSKLVEGYRTCSSFLQANQNCGASAFHRNMLDYMLRRFLLPLHCPFARMASSNPVFYYSRKVGLDVAMAIITSEHDVGFSRLLTIGGGMFREGILCAATTVAIELIAQVESQRLDGTLMSASLTREPAKRALITAISLATERINEGETNIKTHLLLSMALGQTEAIELGNFSDFTITQSAKKSLELCHGLLSAQTLSPTRDQSGELSMNLAEQDDWSRDLNFDFDLFSPDASSFAS